MVRAQTIVRSITVATRKLLHQRDERTINRLLEHESAEVRNNVFHIVDHLASKGKLR